MTEFELIEKSKDYRRKILRYIYRAKAGHTGGSLSCVDILNVLYNEILDLGPENFDSPDRDRYIQSKGHSVEALYVVLADKGFFPDNELETLCCYKSHFVGHPTRKVPGIEQNTGALGHGLALAAGMAMAAKMDNRKYRVFTLLGDGELAEGSNWEAFMSASHYKLDNLCAILDHNKLQITSSTKEVMNTEPIADKLQSFGWSVRDIDGNDVREIKDLLQQLPFEKDKPSFVIAHTVKGKGVSFMENQLKWHHGVPTEEEYAMALDELIE